MSPEVTVILGVHLLHRRIEDRIRDINTDPPLSENERLVLALLEHPRRLGEIARMAEVLPSTISAVAGALEAKGFARRRQDPDDGRAWLLERSDAGDALADDLGQSAARVFRQMTGFGDAEIDELARLLAPDPDPERQDRPARPTA